MSTQNQDGEEERLIVQGREYVPHSAIAGIVGLSARNSIIESIHNEQISQLQSQLDDKEQELVDLRKRVKDLEKKNTELKFQLQQKCDEVRDLRQRISKLEDEKKDLHDELCSVKITVNSLKESIKELSKSKDDQTTKYSALEIKIQNIESSQKEAEEELEATKRKNRELSSKIEQLNRQKRYVEGGPLCLPVQASQQFKAMSILSDLACVILSILYKIVLPDSYTPALRSSYTVERIERDINRLPMPDEERKKAKSRWQSLKEDLNLVDDQFEALSSLRESRNSQEVTEEHLEEQLLRQCAKYLEEEHLLKGWLTMEHVSSLIEIWKKLAERPVKPV